MSAVTFDTLKFVETLEAAKIDGEQARAIAAAVRDGQQSADVATKGDLAAVRADLRELETRLDAKIDKVDAKLDMLKWMLAAVFAAVMLPLIKSFF